MQEEIREEKKAESYEKILQYQQGLHEKNQKRIKVGIKLVILIPLIFLLVMFKLESSKVVFLVLWIVSLFVISAYLIGVEYMDYEMQVRLGDWGISEDKEIKNLLEDHAKIEQMIRNSGVLEALPQVEQIAEKEAEEKKQLEVQAEKLQVAESVQTMMQSEQNSVIKELTDETDELGIAEEELVQSIRRYVHALSVQTTQQNTIQKKSPQDYAEMRRAKAQAMHALEKKDSASQEI